MTARPLSLLLYAAAMGAAEPLTPLILKARAKRGKEDAARLGERLGKASVARPSGPLVWLHGVSVGESLSLLPLIDRIRSERPQTAILVTSGTVTSAALLAKRLPPGVIHQFAPIDGPRTVRRFLDHWRPDTAIFAESELWPNLILGAKARGAKLALVSARITEHSAKGWAKRPAAARALLGSFDLILPQDRQSAERLEKLGARPGPALNLKYVGAALPVEEGQLASLKKQVAKRLVVLAASTHVGEDEIIATAAPNDALLVIAPRHPDRGHFIELQMLTMGRRTARRSKAQPITADTNVYIADTLGEMGLLFSLADVAVIGGSFSPGIGGHNPLEPARLDVPAISGREVFNFADVYEEMAAEDAVVLTDEYGLPGAITRLLTDPAAAKIQAKAAADYARRQTASFETGWNQLKALIP